MATTTLNVSASTWIFEGNSSNHSGDTLLKTNMYYEGQKNNIAVLQFTIPSAYRYKRITKATLRFYITGSGTAVGVKIAPYNAGAVLASLTGANIDAQGTLGERITVENSSGYGGSYPTWKTADVTSLLASNLYNNTYLTLFVSAFPGYPPSPAQIGGYGHTNAAQLIIEYEDVTQLAPTPSYPVGAYVNENTDILFSWAWNSSTAAVQASVQLEYKLKSAANYTTVSLTQTSHTYTLAGGLPQGAYQWRIKGTNDAGETSAYSEVAEFTVIGKPSVPVINTPANKSLTEITWQASDQNSFDITLTDSNGKQLINETVASSASLYKPNMFLKGTYSVGIRYRNSTGLTSEWAYKAFSITAAGPAKPTMTLYGNGENARIVVTRDLSTRYALMRAEDANLNFKIVKVFDEDETIDRTAKFNTGYSYKVRAYVSAGYTDSDVAHFRCNSDRVALQTADIEIFLEASEENFYPYTEEATGEIAIFKCPGRDFPIVEHGEDDNWIFSSSLFATEEQKEKLRKISKENYIFYRDYSGRAFPVAIRTLSFNRWMNKGYIANIEFVRIAEREVVVNV